MVDSSFDLIVYIYSYDEDRITNVSTNFNINSDIIYDSQDRISSRKTLGTNCNIEEEFDYVTKSDNVTNLVNNHIVRINNEEIKINDYTYDDNGNIINIYNGYNTDYVYDKLGRLIRENNEQLNKSITYKYDKSGNIIQKQTSDYTLETKLTNTLKDNYIYSGTSWKDKLIKFKDKTFEYDNLGRPVKIDDNVLTWNSKGKLSSYGNILFDYDINGYRKSKTVNGVVTKYYTFDNRIVREETNGSYITYIYNVDRLIGFCYNGISYIYERNILGDIIGIYNASTKEKVATYAYTGYGEHVVHNYTSNNIGDINPFRYRGYYYDVETNLFLVSSRYYSPELCRWISPDDIEYLDPESVNGLNLYCYCANNPIMYVDPDGHMPKWAQWVVGGLAVAGLIVATVLTCGAAGAGAAAVGTAMLVGGVVSGGIEIIDQLHDTGTVDWTSVAISTLSGTAYGLVVGLSGGAAAGAWSWGAFAGILAVAGGTSLLNSWNENATFGETMKSLGISLLVSGAAQGAGYLAGKFGPQLLTKFMPRNPNHLGGIGSALWAIPAVKTGAIRLVGGVFGSIFNDF